MFLSPLKINAVLHQDLFPIAQKIYIFRLILKKTAAWAAVFSLLISLKKYFLEE